MMDNDMEENCELDECEGRSVKLMWLEAGEMVGTGCDKIRMYPTIEKYDKATKAMPC